MSVADIIGIAGFVLASASLVWQWHRYYLPVRMVIDGMDIGWTEDNQSMAMFRITLVNPSARGRTMCRLEHTCPSGIIVSKAPHQLTEDLGAVVYLSPKGDEPVCSPPIPRSEALEPPLDILPGQSQAKYCVLIFHLFGEWADMSNSGKEFPFGFQALDASGNEIASKIVKLYPFLLRNKGIHTFPKA